MNNSSSFAFIVFGLFLALGLVGGGYFVGQTMYNAKVGVNTAEAKGLAERRVKADQVTWAVHYSVTALDRSDMQGLYKRAETDQKKILDVLAAQGFNEEQVQVGVIDYRYTEYRDDNQTLVDQRHTLDGKITIESDRVDAVTLARSKVNSLIAQGVEVQNNAPAYRFTKLNDIKPAMLKEAAGNARIAANEFAQNAGTQVGKIRSARQGGFNVVDAGADYGDTAKLYKDVRVVTTISFYLTD